MSSKFVKSLFACAALFIVFLFFPACVGKKLPPLDISYPTKPMQLPKDLAAHDWARMEWWYYTGHLETADGQKFGFELVFFRHRPDMDHYKKVSLKDLKINGYMAHFAVVDEATGKYVYRSLVTTEGKFATAATNHYAVRLNDWRASGDLESHRISAETTDAGIKLELRPLKPPVMHGDHGIVAKGEGLANYYMSFTRMDVLGDLMWEGRKLPVKGIAWFDHEYGNMGKTPSRGWDWYSLQLDDNTEYMIYALHRQDKTVDPVSKACRIDPAGTEQCVPYGEIVVKELDSWKSPHTGAGYPSGWQITIPAFGLEAKITPTVKDQEMRFMDMAYWEGSCSVSGKPANGQAYVELVGYAPSKIMKMGSSGPTQEGK